MEKTENFEKQVQNLEDENEKYINELSQAESIIEKFKMEIENLKIKVNICLSCILQCWENSKKFNLNERCI